MRERRLGRRYSQHFSGWREAKDINDAPEFHGRNLSLFAPDICEFLFVGEILFVCRVDAMYIIKLRYMYVDI